LRGIRTASASQCTAKMAWGLSINLPGHRIATCLGKAALKMHALQTLTRPPLTRLRARSVWSAPAERSGDGALALPRMALATSSSGVEVPHNPKRRGASLPAAVQDAGPRGAPSPEDPSDRGVRPRRDGLDSTRGSWSHCTVARPKRLSMSRNSQIGMTNHEIQRNTEIRMTKPPIALLSVVRHLSFGFFGHL